MNETRTNHRPRRLARMAHAAARVTLVLAVALGLTGGVALASPPAATPAGLGTAESFAVLGGQTVTNTGASIVTGNLGVSPGTAIVGFPPGIVIGEIHAGDAIALQAKSDLTSAYNALAGQACGTDLTGQDLGGLTLLEGVYCFSSSAQLTGQLTLDAQGNPAAAWIFQIASGLNTASGSSVLVINGGNACRVFWQVGSSATLGTANTFAGNILALTDISLATGTQMSGRALARNGAVTMDTNDISLPPCGMPTGVALTEVQVGTSPQWVPFGLAGAVGLALTLGLVLLGFALRRRTAE